MERIRVEVVYALPRRQLRVSMELPAGTTAIAAILASGLCETHPEIELAHGRIGVYGTVVAPHTALADGDRVEIYRPMSIDPKAARRTRAAQYTRPAGNVRGRR